MKYLRYIAIAALASLGLTSCDDFFDTGSDSAVDGSLIYTKPELTQAALNGVYNLFSENNSYRNRMNCGYWGLNTDIEFNGKTNAAELELCRYNEQLTNGQVSKSDGKDPWGYFTTAIERVNCIIDGMEEYANLDDGQMAAYLGEAYFLRGFIYMELTKVWGDVPAIFEPMSATTNLHKQDRNIIFEQMRADFSRAAELLPEGSTIIKPCKQAAWAMLARTDLYYAGYALRPDQWIDGGGSTYGVQFNVKDPAYRAFLYGEAMDACAQVINKDGDAKLLANFEDVFKKICADNTVYAGNEFIYALPFKDGARGQFMNYNCIKSSDAFGALRNNEAGSTNSVQLINPVFVFDYDKSDKRKFTTIAPFSWTADKGSGISSTDMDAVKLAFPNYTGTKNAVYQKKQSAGKFYLGKYRVEWMSRLRSGNDDGVDFPIIRYADVLMMYAEASLGGISGDVPSPTVACSVTPQAAFDKIRTRAGLSSLPLTMDNIMKERAFEFCGEYLRKCDLMRWGKLKEKLVEAQTRVNNLRDKTGEFASVNDSIWFTYKMDDYYLFDGTTTAEHAYVIDKIVGLDLSETERPAEFDKNAGWVAKAIYINDENVKELKDYKIYESEDLIDKRHYWPIFSVNVASSNGALWNDYDY